ncbi:MAG: hypothetical protein LKM45_06670, partial [Wolbachia endosymbiont of Alcedoecus sp.]|nr:hypothetical protein [Wolbachia endosymbiont of Alcedoecus sp.]
LHPMLKLKTLDAFYKIQAFNFKITNLYCAEVSSPVLVADFKYPVRNADLAKSNLLFSSFSPTKYGIDDSYKELIFTIGGLKFADNVGEIVTYPKGAKVNEKEMNLMKCDGRALGANGISPLGIEYKRLHERLGYPQTTFSMLQTEETPNWFNAISSEYIKRFVEDNEVKVKFEGKGVVSPKPEGDNIGHLWLETTFYANSAVDYNFQYVATAGSVELITCCHSFDISIHYTNSEFRIADSAQKTKFANSEIDFPGYFQSASMSNSLYLGYKEKTAVYEKGIDVVTEQTEANYSVEGGFFYLTIYLDYRSSQYPSGFKSIFNPIRFYRRVYDIGFPLIIPLESSTFIQRSYTAADEYFPARSQNYFLFSPWFVEAMSTIDGFVSVFSTSNGVRLLEFYDNNLRDLYVKSWGDHII